MEFITTLLILGAAQGLFLAALLATRQANVTANRILAAAMVAYTLFLLAGVYYTRGWFTVAPQFIGWNIPLVFLFGPLHYFYARALIARGAPLGPRAWLHLLPTTVVIFYLTPFFLRDGAYKLAYLQALEQRTPLDLAIIEQLQFAHGIAYVALTIRLLRTYRARLRDTHSTLDRINLSWLSNLTIGIALVWAIATTMNVLDLVGVRLTMIEGTVTPIGVACLVYAAGYLGLRQPEIFHGRSSSYTPPPMPVAPPAPEPAQPRGYEKSGLSPAEAAEMMRRLTAAMQDQRPYLDSGLTLQDLADLVAISPHNLSEVINTQAGKNFYDFINQYRIEEAKRRLRDPKYANLTILAIAGDAGFNSKATFNAFFKRYTGITPSRYRAGQESAV